MSRYELQYPEVYKRNGELIKNQTNLPCRWKGRALSNNLEDLKEIKRVDERIIDRYNGEIVCHADRW